MSGIEKLSGGPPAVVLGLSPTGLYVARELAEHGVHVLGASDEFACGGFSRAFRDRRDVWRVRSADDVCERVEELHASTGTKPVLIPTSDRFVALVCRRAQQLADIAVFQASYGTGLAARILDKDSFYSLCDAHGVPVPRRWRISDPPAVGRAAREAALPCIAKPDLIHESKHLLAGRKLLVLKSQNDWRRLERLVGLSSGRWILQEIVPGPESNIVLFGGVFGIDGDPIDAFTARKLRQFPPGFGSASLAISEANEEVLQASISFLKSLRFSGLCGTEFKHDPRDGRLKMIEVNPRPTLWFQLTRAAGKSLAVSMYRDLAVLGQAPISPQRQGVVWCYALKDLYSRAFYAFRGSRFVLPGPDLPEFTGKGKCVRTWCVWDRSDPLPALMEPIHYIWSRVGRR